MTRGFAVFCILILVGSFPACSGIEGPPENPIEEDTYINLLIELQLLKSYQESIPPDSVDVDSLKGLIFDKYGVTEQQFRVSHSLYQQQIDQQQQRVVRAIDSLKMEIGGEENMGMDSLRYGRNQ